MRPERTWRHDEEIEALRDTQDDARQTRTMFRASFVGATLGALAGAVIGFAAAAAMYGPTTSGSFVMVVVALAFAGGVAGGVLAGWRGGLADKAVDEQRPSFRDRDLRMPRGTTPKGWS